MVAGDLEPASVISFRRCFFIFMAPMASTVMRTSTPSRARLAKASATSSQMPPVHQT